MEREALAYHPDIVILNFCMHNDFIDNSRAKFKWDNVYPKPYYVYENGRLQKRDAHLKLSIWGKTIFLLAQKSLLFNELLRVLHIDRDKYKRRLIREEIQEKVDVELTFRLIHRMAAIAQEKGFHFLVLIFPNKEEFKDKSKLAEQFFTSPLLQGIDRVNMYRLYADKGFNQKTFGNYTLDNCLHLNPAGHKLTGNIIYELLRVRKWIPIQKKE